MSSFLIYFFIQTDYCLQLQVWFHQSKTQLEALLLYRVNGSKNHWYLFPVKGLLLIWVSWVVGPMSRELHFGIRIILGTIHSGLPVFEGIVPGCSRSGSGAYAYLRVQKKFVKFGLSTQNKWFRSAKLLGQFFRDPAFDFLWNLSDEIFSHLRNERERVLRLAVPSKFLCFPWNSC